MIRRRMKQDAAATAGIIKARRRNHELWVTSVMAVAACLASKDKCKECGGAFLSNYSQMVNKLNGRIYNFHYLPQNHKINIL